MTTESNSSITSIEITEQTKGSASFVNEVQRVTINPDGESIPSGTFVLTFGGDQTRPLAVTVSADGIMEALEELPSIRGTINVNCAKEPWSWIVTFMSPGPQELLASPCERKAVEDPLPSCLIKDASVAIHRLVRGSSPVSGTFRLQLVPADYDKDSGSGHYVSSTPPLSVDATANEVQEAITHLNGGEMANVAIVPNPLVEYGLDWVIHLNNNGIAALRLADVHIEGSGPWCTDGIVGPAVASTPCVFPFTTGEDHRDVHFSCAGAVGPYPGWCLTSTVFDGEHDWGRCVRCTEGMLAPPTLHVTPVRRSFRLSGLGAQVSRALSEVVYHPRPEWNAWLGGHDEVTASWSDATTLKSSGHSYMTKATSISPVLVVPVNDPPTVTLKRQRIVAHEGRGLMLDGIDIWDPDIAERPQNSLQVLLEAGSGTLALSNPSGLTFLEGTPQPYTSGKLAVKGPLSLLRSVMRHVFYRPLDRLAAGTAARRSTQEVQRLELTAPLLPMVQSITTSSTKGYIEGNFTLGLNCSAFIDVVDFLFPEANHLSHNISTLYVISPTISSDAPANGNGSMEEGINVMLRGCVDLASDRASFLTQRLISSSSGNSSFREPISRKVIPHNGATTIVSRGKPDLHGGLTWAITLLDVPQFFPLFELKGSNFTSTGRLAEDSPYAFNATSVPTDKIRVSITIAQEASSSAGPNGTFTLAASQSNETTVAIPSHASGEEVAAALAELTEIGAVQVSAGPLLTDYPASPTIGRYWEITFLRSGSPIHVGDVQSLEAGGMSLSGGATLRVSEVRKGRAPGDFVSITVDDLGNVGETGPLRATATWEIVIVPADIAPDVQIDLKAMPEGFLRAIEGTVLPLPAIQISHDVYWDEATGDSVSDKLRYTVRLSCARGNVELSPSATGNNLTVTTPSDTVTRLSGTLGEVNRALSSLRFHPAKRYHGVADVEIAARLAGSGIDGGWGTATIYVFVDDVNTAPELSAPRWLRTTSTGSIVLGGISVTDDDPEENMTVSVRAVHGFVSLHGHHRLRPLGDSTVRRCAEERYKLPAKRALKIEFAYGPMLVGTGSFECTIVLAECLSVPFCSFLCLSVCMRQALKRW